MWQQLRNRLLGTRAARRSSTPSLDETILNGRIRSVDSAPKPWRTVGITEQRLRDKNKRSWLTSSKGWSEVLGRFSRIRS
ncbi:MAG TPA: hypothetical protein VFD22_00090 [Gemmatimonadaceae bacterium]|jgi:hypothetical protein|nr:hypothetical protein [Gemmatimonadaceae bacterium]